MSDARTASSPADNFQQRSAAPADGVLDALLVAMGDGLDHPEIWTGFPAILQSAPDLVSRAIARLNATADRALRMNLALICILAQAVLGDAQGALDNIEQLTAEASQSPLVQGVSFHIHGLLDAGNPKYQLAKKICYVPFFQMDVLEQSTHLCCASWIGTSVGKMAEQPWQDVWNSDAAQKIRGSILDGSYRYCNKIACPIIQNNELVPAENFAAKSPLRRRIVEEKMVSLPQAPEAVNLAYDRTCNLSCPSCRVTAYAADAETRDRFDTMQQTNILPMLRDAKTVTVTGSGDPFASKNFRRLMEQLGPQDYPDLRFQILTNGMLFNRREWERFPALHGRVKWLKISIDAGRGPTHEMLRRGAQWNTMLENMRFAGDLRAAGMIQNFWLIFVVQIENYEEMGEAVDLAKMVGASGITFARLTNWGTFSAEEYRRKAIFLQTHPQHDAFLRAMGDSRLRDPVVVPGDLIDFFPQSQSAAGPVEAKGGVIAKNVVEAGVM